MERIAERAALLAPDDPTLAETYDRSCKLCHSVSGTGAPLTGDGADWRARMMQGMDVLLDHTIRGHNGMPPLGMCPDCTRQDFQDLIVFMAADAGE